MKQNERILVYAVTGFLAIILVVAVLFGRDGAPASKPAPVAGAPGLADVFKTPAATNDLTKPAAGKPDGTGSGEKSGLPSPTQVAGEQPLVAPSKPMIVADLVAQQLGSSRRDHTVRFVRARSGDSLDTLVRRWCGSGQFLEEAKSLNEDLTVIRVGQEVAVPWVDDEVVYAAFEARQPKKLQAEVAEGDKVGSGGPVPATANGATNGVGKATEALLDGRPLYSPPSNHVTLGGTEKPDAGKQGGGKPAAGKPEAAKPDAGKPCSTPPVAGGTPAPKAGATPVASTKTKSYTVRSGDSLWKIAERLAGKKGAAGMVTEIKRLNPGLTDKLAADQKIVVPDAAPAAPAVAKPGP